MTYKTALIQLMLGVVAISFSPIFVKWVDVPPSVSAFYRSFYAAVILLLITVTTSKHSRLKGARRWLGWSVLAGVFLAIDLIIWHKTIIYIGAGPATLLGNSQVIFVSLLVFLFFKETIHSAFWLLLPLVFIGLYLAIPSQQIVVSQGQGLLLGLLVGLTYAGFLLCLRLGHRAAGADYPELFNLGIIMSVCALLIGSYTTVMEQIPLRGYGLSQHMMMVLMALLAQVMGWLLIQSSIIRLPGHQGSLLLLVQPVLALIWGRLFFHEPLSLVQITGIILALGSIATYQLCFATRGRQLE